MKTDEELYFVERMGIMSLSIDEALSLPEGLRIKTSLALHRARKRLAMEVSVSRSLLGGVELTLHP